MSQQQPLPGIPQPPESPTETLVPDQIISAESWYEQEIDLALQRAQPGDRCYLYVYDGRRRSTVKSFYLGGDEEVMRQELISHFDAFSPHQFEIRRGSEYVCKMSLPETPSPNELTGNPVVDGFVMNIVQSEVVQEKVQALIVKALQKL